MAVVGRPNVGKSTLFNRFSGRRLAIVDDTPGVTRDRNFQKASWAGRTFFVVDTGGVVEGTQEPLEREVRRQALAAVEEADLVLFVVDGRVGPHPLDERLAQLLRDSSKPILLVVNKMDNLPEDRGHLEFWSLGIGQPWPVSAASGKGSGDLLDAIVRHLPPDSAPEEEPAVRVAVVGRPNVGKSSFVNRLLGEDRTVVSPEAGTTRDPVDSPMVYHGSSLVFVDTAGLRRHSRISGPLEYYSALRTERVVEEADICLLLVDAAAGVGHQDLRLVEKILQAGAGLILVVNKWDLVEKDSRTAPLWEKTLRKKVPVLEWVPVLFASALTGLRVRKTLDLILEVQHQRTRRIETHEVNRVLRELVDRQPPPHSQGRPVKLRYATQVAVAPPTFSIFSNLPRAVPIHYIRYLHNGFRKRWGFVGSPLRILLREQHES